jgi:hypothetical protein
LRKEPAVRVRAANELKALGAAALLLLEKHKNYKDPEFRMTIRELLGQ